MANSFSASASTLDCNTPSDITSFASDKTNPSNDLMKTPASYLNDFRQRLRGLVSRLPFTGSTKSQARHIAAICERASQGDLEARISDLDESTPLGQAGLAINRMLDIADSFVRESSAAMDHCGRKEFHRPVLLRGLPGAYLQAARIINRAGLQMKEDSDQLDLVSRVAAACEELNGASAHISERAREAAALTAGAVNSVNRASDSVAQLDVAARKIESIVVLINQITVQTDLLALNAAIEAAHAGDRGASFGVVADEVKSLAQGAANATREIREQIDSVQDMVKLVSGAIESVRHDIQEVNSGTELISRAVAEQVQATGDISRSIHEISGHRSSGQLAPLPKAA